MTITINDITYRCTIVDPDGIVCEPMDRPETRAVFDGLATIAETVDGPRARLSYPDDETGKLWAFLIEKQ